jgi:plasmid stability protein
MADLVIPDIDNDLFERLRLCALANARSVEDEARERLQESFAAERQESLDSLEAERETLGAAIRRLFGTLDGVELELPDRREFVEREPPDFSGPEWDWTEMLPIRSEAEYGAALAEIEAFFVSEPAPGTREADRFDRLARVIADDERRHWTIESP